MKLLRAAGVPPAGRSPHSTRHTWAALSIASGIDSFLVMESAGHSNLSTTLGGMHVAPGFTVMQSRDGIRASSSYAPQTRPVRLLFSGEFSSD
jgi:hypothetical protein